MSSVNQTKPTGAHRREALRARQGRQGYRGYRSSLRSGLIAGNHGKSHLFQTCGNGTIHWPPGVKQAPTMVMPSTYSCRIELFETAVIFAMQIAGAWGMPGSSPDLRFYRLPVDQTKTGS